MGGKTGTTTQSVQIPPEVMARYNAVNARAENVAQQPFQQYSTDPSAFVAQLNQQQQTGISNINQYANAAQPAYQAAMQGTAGAYGGLSSEGFQRGVQGYMSPFLQNAMGSTAAQMQNVARQQQQDIVGNAVRSGAFGGDRGSVARAALANQQNLALGQTLGNMAQQGYQSAAQNYLTGIGQQGQLAAQMGALGAGAQQAGLQGAQAQLGAGTLGQQTEQAGKTALYNQFLQQQAYPFQVAQFLANIAMGTGALSGSTTTTTQPMPFFSDRRLKEDVKRIGESDEGLPIYKYKYKGDPNEQTHIGFMADEVEKKHPEAVGIAAGYKTVDYDKATSEGGAVKPQHAGIGFASGGMPYGGIGYVPESNIQVGKLMTPGAAPDLPESELSQLGSLAKTGMSLYKDYDWLKSKGFASGGMPYDEEDKTEDKTKLDIPTEKDTHQLAVAGAPPSAPDSGLSDIMNLAKTAATIYSMSDRRLKENIKRIGKTDDGLPIYKFKYKGDPNEQTHIGFMADDVEKKHPEAVKTTSGYKVVNYEKATENINRIHKKDGGPLDESSPDFWRNYTMESAKRAGIDPDFAAKVFHGESGFNPRAVGDEGSSFGIAQLHYGDQSQKYPRPGLGDEFTKQTGLDARDPANQKAAIDWSTKYAAEHGWGPWTAARNLQKQADIPAFGSSEAQASPMSPTFNVGKPDSTDILLSVLAGLGSMAESKSPFLGGALLAGIGGGAKTYAGLRAQQSEIALRQSEAMKNTMGLMAQRFSPVPGGNFFDAWNNRVVSPQERAQAAVEMGLPPSFVGMAGSGGEGFAPPAAGGIAGGAPAAGGIAGAPAGAPAPQGGIAPPPAMAQAAPQEGGAAPKTATDVGAPVPPATPKEGQPMGMDKADQIYAAAEAHPDVQKYFGLAEESNKQALALEEEAHKWTASGIPEYIRAAETKIQQANMMRAQAVTYRDQGMKLRESYAKLPLEKEAETAKIAGQTKTVYSLDGTPIEVPGDKYLEIVRKGGGDVNGVPVIPSQSAYLQPIIDNYKDFNTKASKFMADYAVSRPQLAELAHIYQMYQGGGAGASESLANLSSFLQKMGIDNFSAESAGFDAAYKLATDIAIKTANSMAEGAPAASLRDAMIVAPKPSDNPDALYKNITNRMAAADFSNDMYRTWDDAGQPKNITGYINQFTRNNKYEDYRKKAYEETEPFAGSTEAGRAVTTGSQEGKRAQEAITIEGSTPAERLQAVKRLPPRTKFIIPDGPKKGQIGEVPAQ